MQLLVIYHWTESHCCPYLFSDVLFPAGRGLRGYNTLPLRQWSQPSSCSSDPISGDLEAATLAHALCLWVPVWAVQGWGLECPTLSAWEKKTLFLRNIYSYLLGASEGDVGRGSSMRQHSIHYFQNSHLLFGHLLKVLLTWLRRNGQDSKIGNMRKLEV